MLDPRWLPVREDGNVSQDIHTVCDFLCLHLVSLVVVVAVRTGWKRSRRC